MVCALETGFRDAAGQMIYSDSLVIYFNKYSRTAFVGKVILAKVHAEFVPQWSAKVSSKSLADLHKSCLVISNAEYGEALSAATEIKQFSSYFRTAVNIARHTAYQRGQINIYDAAGAKLCNGDTVVHCFVDQVGSIGSIFSGVYQPTVYAHWSRECEPRKLATFAVVSGRCSTLLKVNECQWREFVDRIDLEPEAFISLFRYYRDSWVKPAAFPCAASGNFMESVDEAQAEMVRMNTQATTTGRSQCKETSSEELPSFKPGNIVTLKKGSSFNAPLNYTVIAVLVNSARLELKASGCSWTILVPMADVELVKPVHRYKLVMTYGEYLQLRNLQQPDRLEFLETAGVVNISQHGDKLYVNWGKV